MSNRSMKTMDVGSIYMFSNVAITAAVFFLPLLLERRGISDVNIGLLALPYSIALFSANSIFGKLTDSHGRKPFLLIGMISAGLTTIFYIVPQTFFMFLLARIFNGLALGMFPAAITAIASDRNMPMGELSSWRAAGWATGAIINGFLSDLLQLEAVFAVGGLFFGVGFIIAVINDTGGFADTKQQEILKEENVDPNYFEVIRHNWQVYLTVILRHASGSSIWIYWSLFLKFNLDLSDTQIGIVLAINTITQALVMKFFGDLGNPQKMLVAGTFLSAISFYSFTLTTNFLEISLTQILLGVSFAFFLVGGLRVSEVRGKQIGMVGTSTGLFYSSFSISQLFGPIFALIIFSKFRTYTSMMHFAAVVTTLAAILYGIIITQTTLDVEENDKDPERDEDDKG